MNRLVNAVRRAAVAVWWAPSWWMTRLILRRNPDHAWKRTTSIHMMAALATPLFKQMNALTWLLLIQPPIGALIIYHRYFF